jgi:hypothetical protein
VRYIDSGSRNPANAVATWLTGETPENVAEFRWQAGYYSLDGLSFIAPILDRLAQDDRLVAGIVGSNDRSTVRTHVEELVRILGLPRAGAKLGVASFEYGLYHPKTYHIRRQDGSQGAFVGSANLTASGLGSLNIEAGILLDTREGDAPEILDEIAAAVDAWFDPCRDGLEIIQNLGDVTRLEEEGILCAVPPPRNPRPVVNPAGRPGHQRPGLGMLVRPPQRGPLGVIQPVVPIAGPQAPLLAVRQAQYPAYVLFAPGQGAPTYGAEALTGAALPGGAVGLIIRLNNDSARVWNGRVGTANISIPVATISTFRFGMVEGLRRRRPKSAFPLKMRFIYPGGVLQAPEALTGIMLYGYSPEDAGHRDIRMNVSAPATRRLRQDIVALGRVVPQTNDVALFEWPTVDEPSVRLTFLERGSPLYVRCAESLEAAGLANHLVGRGAYWLTPGLSPEW